MPQTQTFEEFMAVAPGEDAQMFESFVGEPKYAENIQQIFTLTDRLQKDPEVRQAYVRKYWKEQGEILSRQRQSPYFGNPVEATTHLLQTVPKAERARIQKEKSDEWQNEAKNVAIGQFFKKRTQLANALWNQVHIANPDVSDDDAYEHMHKHLQMYGYQPPGAGKLPPLVMREGQWENEYVPGWTEFRHGVKGVATGTYDIVTGLPRLVGMAAEAITDWTDPSGGAYVTGTNPYREARIKHDYQRQNIEQYLTRGMAKNVPYMPEGFSPAMILGEQLPQFAITAGAAGLVKLGLVSKFVGRVITAASMFAKETPQAYDEYLRYAEERGMDPREASQIAAGGAAAYGVVAGVLESYGPFELMAKTNPVQFSLAVRLALGTVAEGGTELTQSGAQFATAYLLDLKKPERDDFWTALNEGLAGMIMGPLAGGFTNKTGPRATPPQIAAPSTTIDPGEVGPVVREYTTDERTQIQNHASLRLSELRAAKDGTPAMTLGGIDIPAGKTRVLSTSERAELQFLEENIEDPDALLQMYSIEKRPAEVMPEVTPEVTPEAAPGTLAREQVIDHMVEMTPETERSDITRPAFESVLSTLRHGQDAFVEVEVPIEQLDLNLMGQEEPLARRKTIAAYAKQDAATAPAIVAGSVDDSGSLMVVDGARRVQAAQQRGDTTVKALVPQTDARTVTPTVTPEAAPEVKGRDRRAPEIPIERGKSAVLSTTEYIEQQRTARQEWGESPEQIDENLRHDAQRVLKHAEEWGGSPEDIATRKQRATEVLEALGQPTTEAPAVATREGEAKAETQLVKKSISLVQQKLGREGSKITDSKSLAEVGMAIAEIVGLDPDVDITWQFKTMPNQVGDSAVHRKMKDGTHQIIVRHGTKFRKDATITPRIAARKSQAGMKIGPVTPSKTNLYRVIIHELGHIAEPPTGGEQFVADPPRKVHHDAFVRWVEEGVSKLIGTTYVKAPAVEPTATPENVPMTEDKKPVPGITTGEAPQTVGGVIKRFMADDRGGWNPQFTREIVGGVSSGLTEGGALFTGLLSLTDESAPLRRTDAGMMADELVSDAEAKARTKIGEHTHRFLSAHDKLSTEEKRWMETIREDGQTNWATLIEHPERLMPGEVTPALQTIAQAYLQQQRDSAQGAVRSRLPQRHSDGTVGIFKPAKGGRYYRILTPQGASAIHTQAGPVWDALIAWHQKYSDRNPDLPTDALELKKKLAGERTSGKTRQAHSLEYTRVFKELPTALVVNGEQVAFQEMRPTNHFRSSTESQWRRIAFWGVIQNRLLPRYGTFNEKTGNMELPHPQNKALTDVDGLVDRLRADIVRQEAMKGKRGHAARAEQAYKSLMNNFFRQFQGGLMEEVFSIGDQSNKLMQTAVILDRNLMASILSFSGLWDVAQPTAAVHIIGLKNLNKAYVKATVEFVKNRREYAAEYQAIGAVMHRHNDWTLRKVQGELTGGLLERVTPQAMMTWAEGMERWAQTVTATAFDLWATDINGNLKDRQARDLRTDLRLTDAEILEVARGEMSAQTRAKIIQNGVKTTNHLAEDPMHRGKLQNNRLLRFFVPFTSVVSGNLRAAGRTVTNIMDDVKRVKRGDKGAVKDLLKSTNKMMIFLVGCFGRGFVQNMLRRLLTGQPLLRPEEEDDWAGTLLECLGEGAIFGPYWRIMEAIKYGGGNPHQMAVNLLPRAAIWVEAISALQGLGKYEGTTWGKRMERWGYKVSPFARSIKNWHSKMVYPGRADYTEVRSRVRMFREAEGDEPARGFGPTNQYYYAVFEAVRDQNDTALETAIADYKEWAKAEGRTSEEARTGLRAALQARRPINLQDDRLKKFLASLTEPRRETAEQQQREYTSWMDRVTRRTGVKRKRKKQQKRPRKQRGDDWYGID